MNKKFWIKIILTFTFCSPLFLTINSYAEDFPFDTNQSAADELEKGFEENKGIIQDDLTKMNSDRLKIGGSLKQEYKNYRLKNSSPKQLIFSPATLSLYLDSALNDNVRGYFKGQFIHDSSIDESVNNNLISYLSPTKQNLSQLDELKILFNAHQKVFFTLGVQKIKWGTGLFWNPTDFLNSTQRDFLKSEDTRSGLSLVKIHIPKDRMNFYFIANFENANQTESLGFAGRAEAAFDNSEWSISHYSKEGLPSLTGLDTSFALGDFDFTIEGSQDSFNKQKMIDGSIGYTWQYADNKNMTFTLEGLWNQDGASSMNEYVGLISQGKFVPFKTAKAYQLISIYSPKPFDWINSNLQFLIVRNQIDESLFSRISYSWTGQRDLTLGVSLGHRNGKDNSEMTFAGQNTELLAEATIQF